MLDVVETRKGDLSKAPRASVHRVVLQELKPIQDLVGAQFLTSTLQIVHCHYHAWISGIRHQDISLATFAYTVDSDGENRGALCDWDLAQGQDESSKRVGTAPFMAMDLLKSPSINMNAEHLYRYDLEAVFWVMVWVSCRKGTLSQWETGNYRQRCLRTKLNFIAPGSQTCWLAKDGWKGMSMVTLEIGIWLNARFQAQNDLVFENRIGRILGSPPVKAEDETTEQTWLAFRECLRSCLSFISERKAFEDIAVVLEEFLKHAEEHSIGV
ncbi:hypothetical protein PENSPDRAFT_615510, partial [Peniophora sp. CONT]